MVDIVNIYTDMRYLLDCFNLVCNLFFYAIRFV